MKKLNIEVIRTDGGTQPRLELNNDKVAEYAECMKDGDKFPPVIVFWDGSNYWLADGFHRYHATRRIEVVTIEAEVKEGTVDEAQVFAFGANAKHGLYLTAADIREIIKRMLLNSITISWTNAQIARHIGCSKMTVGRVKASLEPATKPQEPVAKTVVRKDGTERSLDTTKLSTKKPAPRPEKTPEQELAPVFDENEQKINELIDTIDQLSEENQKLKDAIAVGQWDASEIEKIDVQETLADLRAQIKTLEIDNRALRDSRDMFQNRNAELLKTVKSLQAKLKKLEAQEA